MPDFSRPEYASYRQFCRTLSDLRWSQRDERWRLGDWYTLDSDDEPAEPALQWGWWIGATIAISEPEPPVVRLPALADWLEMLEAEGCRYFRFYDVAQVKRARSQLTDGWMAKTLRHSRNGGTQEWRGHGPIREEAAARLYVAVTQTPADPSPPSAAR